MSTVTKKEIAGHVAAEFGSMSAAKNAVTLILDAISNAIAGGGRVQLAGLGVFEVKATKARVGRDPRTGEPIDVPARKKVAFKAATALKERL